MRDFALESVASAFLRWPQRRELSVLDFDRNKPEEMRGLKPDFVEHLARQFPRLHDDDIMVTVERFATSYHRFYDWYGCLVRGGQVSLTVFDGTPRVVMESLSAWRAITAKIDPDSLVARHLAEREVTQIDRHVLSGTSPAEQVVAGLEGWRFFIPPRDRIFQQVVAKGLADLHLHLEASDPFPLLWLRIMGGFARVSEVRRFASSTLALLRDTGERQDRRHEAERIRDARRLRPSLFHRLGLGHLLWSAYDGEFKGLSALKAERTMLLAAWYAIKQHGNRTGRLEQDFDRYLFAKNLFIENLQQSPGSNPGLTRFRAFLDQSDSLAESRKKHSKPRVHCNRLRRQLHLTCEVPELRKIEIRIAPMKTVAAYARFFRKWEAVGREVLAGRDLQIGFIVHFIRDAEQADNPDFDAYFGKLRSTLDRQTSALHLFRRSCPELAKWIVGIDVANKERGCPPEIFAPYLKLLRGVDFPEQPQSCAMLDNWRGLFERGLHEHPIELGQLGLTYHAGEDFYHPLDGIRHMDALRHNLLRAGDRIGHGLAVGVNIKQFYRRRGDEPPPIPQGVLLDNLAWLSAIASRRGLAKPEEISLLEDGINELSREIYGEPLSASEVLRLMRRRYHFPIDPRSTAARGCCFQHRAEKRFFSETWEREIWAKRSRYASQKWARAGAKLRRLTKKLQIEAIKALHADRIFVEINPTSNLVTGAVSRLTDHPFFTYLKALDGENNIVVGSDDPGLFGTQIDIEYGLLLDAMNRRRTGDASPLQFGTLRKNGLELSFIDSAKSELSFLA